MGSFTALVRRELRIRWRGSVGWVAPLLFFLAAAAVFAIALGPAPEVIRTAAPAVLWCAALFASLLSQDAILRADIECGYAEQMVLGDRPLTLLALAKAVAHWLATGVPLAAMTPVAALLLGIAPERILGICALLLAGTLSFSLLAAFVAAISAAARDSLLSTLLALPLAVPTLIFGTIATRDALLGAASLPAVLLLLASLTFALTVLPIATAGTLRVCAGHA